MKHYSAICLMVKNEESYIEEWLQYHRKLGFQHFYIYDNNSDIPIKNSIKIHNDITYIDWKDKEINRHKRAFQHCFKNFKNKNQWIACIDIDEFIVLKTDNKNINIFLKEYKKFGGLGINQVIFGSSGHKTIPKGGVLENYLYRNPFNANVHKWIKSIINTKFINENVLGIHSFQYYNNYNVNSNYEKIKSDVSNNIVVDKIQLNHYIIKSLEDAELKHKKGGGNGLIRTLEQFQKFDINTTILDKRALKFKIYE